MGIGASAGGLEAFTLLLKHLPLDTGMAFVLVQHLDPDHPSALTQLLKRVTSLSVAEIGHNQRVEPNHVYVIPPNRSLSIEQGVLKLQARRGQRAPYLPIDFFFESLAHDQQECAIGIILSGTASDGTLGMEAIKAEGGITFAQNESAKYESMPRNAIGAGCVDFVLSPEGIAQELARIAKHPFVAGEALIPTVAAEQGPKPIAEPSRKWEQGGIKKILDMLLHHSGVDFSLYKPNTVQRRIGRRMVLNKMERAERYASLLRSNPSELETLYSEMLISVTSFFRNPAAFDTLRQKVFPKIFQQPRDVPLRFWILGCSTGQEAYSLAMALVEFGEAAGQPRKLQFFATDVNEAMLEKGRSGLYAKNLVQNLSPEQLRRFFVQEDGGYRVAKFVREMVVFARQNILIDPPFSRMDLISCRNLLIYLDPNLQKRILPAFHYALKPEGFLFLGESETVGSFASLFEPVDKKHKIFLRKPGLTPHLYLTPHHPAENKKPRIPREGGEGQEVFQSQLHTQREADRITLNRFAPPGVLINGQLQVLQFRGDTSRFLRPPAGNATFHVLKMAREGLMLPLRAAIKKAKEDKKAVRREDVQVVQNGSKAPVTFEVIPLRHLNEQCYLIYFEGGRTFLQPDAGQPEPLKTAVINQAPKRAGAGDRAAELERELSETRDYAQSLQEQYEATNEELQSANEEVTSANEELQSINEELETSKEELESANEELTTVNEEMANRNAELNRFNSDLNNLHTSVDLAILVLTRDLTIRRFTPTAEKLFNLVANDVGRPLSNVRHNLDLPDLEVLLKEVIDNITECEREVRDKSGRWFSLRARPYVTVDNKIDGAVLVLLDIDDLKRNVRQLANARDYAEAILRTVRYPLIVLTEDLHVSTANAAFYREFKAVPGQTEGRLIYDLGNGQWNIPKLRQLLGEILPKNSFFVDFEVTHDFEKLGRRTMMLNARRLETGERDGSQKILLAIDDITESKQMERLRETQAQLQKSNEELEIQIQNRTTRLRETVGELEAFSYSVSHDMRAPLRSMQGFANLLLERTKTKLEQVDRDYLERIARSANRLDQLIQDVLSYTKIVRAEVPLQPVDLDRLLRDILDTYPEWQPPRARIQLEGTLPSVQGNQAWLTQCFSNLIGNAAKFVAPGVTPQVRIWAENGNVCEAKKQNSEEVAPVGSPDFVTIWVEDNGIGISPGDHERIFRLFERVHSEKQYAGTGLGLTIVRKAVERMGGQIGFESEPGRGSKFWIQLYKGEA